MHSSNNLNGPKKENQTPESLLVKTKCWQIAHLDNSNGIALI